MTTKKPSKAKGSLKPRVPAKAKGKPLKSVPAKAPRARAKKAVQAAAPPSPAALRQVAALPLRRTDGGGLEVLLITSRETHRWVIPKGWTMRKKSDPQAAATEAMEEGGLLGDIGEEPIGAYAYFKRRAEHFDLVDVTVYRLDVTAHTEEWREKAQREQRWCALEEAADLVQEPGLQALLRELADRL